MLDLAAPACWLATDADRLRPVAGDASAWGPDGTDDPVTFAPDTRAYTAYDEGTLTPVGADAAPADADASGGVFVPLGDHGVLGAGTAGADGVDDTTAGAARVLARHAPIALGRGGKQRAPRERERRGPAAARRY